MGYKDTLDNIDKILPEYERASLAPKSEPLIKDPTELETWKRNERKKRYKAVDKNGDVYLIQNPLAWEMYDKKGYQPFAVRLKPKLVMKAADVAKQSTTTPTPKKNLKDMFGE